MAACHEWFQQAHAAHTRDYRAAVPQDVQAQFATTHTVGSQLFQLPTWVGSFTQPLAALEKSLSDHWDHYTRPFLDALAFPWLKKAAPLVGVVAAILLFLVGSWPVFALGAAAIVALVWGLILRNQAQTAARAQAAARELLERARTESLHQLRGASAELTDWYEKFTAADRAEAKVRELIATLPTAGGAASPFEGRTVRRQDAADPAPGERTAPEQQAAWQTVPEPRPAKGAPSGAKGPASGAKEASSEAMKNPPQPKETSPQPKETSPEPQEDSAR